MPNQDIRVALVHQGCARNLIDSETILGRLGAEGYALTGDITAADVAVLNTCSFIGEARSESEEWVERLTSAKKAGRLRSVIVTGCLPQQFREEVEPRWPEVDAWLGLSDYSGIAQVVEQVLRGRKVQPGDGGRDPAGAADGVRLLQTVRSYAYIRPSRGCDHECAFCIIPDIRGKQVSKPVETVVEESRQLASQGVRELVLVAEDSTGYGADFGEGGARLPDLVRAISDGVPDLAWLRLMYAYPNAFPWGLTELLRERENVVEYLDIPIQHIATPVLKRMQRGGSSESVRRILDRLREEVPGIALRTTVLVGHPGEGAGEFEELLSFLEEFRFERLGAFAFSPEVGTPAGSDTDRCSEEEALDRLDAVMQLQMEVHAAHQTARVGQVAEVLIDGRDGSHAVGRTRLDAPEVDGIVRVQDPGRKLQAGAILPVQITGAEGYDLYARPSDTP